MNDKYFPGNSKKAIATLERVSQEWQDNVVEIEWKVLQPNSKLFAYILGSFFLLCLLFCFHLLYLHFDKNELSASPVIILLIITSPVWYLLFNVVKYSPKTIIINRKKHKGWYYFESNGKNTMKYKDNAILPAFRLPENDDGTYAQMRKELQHAITAETGWRFYDDNFNTVK